MPLARLVAAAAALGLATLGPVLFLHADEAETAPVFTDDPGALDALGEATEQLLEALGVAEFHTHTLFSPPLVMSQLTTTLAAEIAPCNHRGQGNGHTDPPAGHVSLNEVYDTA